MPATNPESENLLCQACQSGTLGPAEIKTAIWHGAKLVVVEDVPAYVCDKCGEQYYEDETAMVLDMMRGDGFDPSGADHKIEVPVFGFRALGAAAEQKNGKRDGVARKNGAHVVDSI